MLVESERLERQLEEIQAYLEQLPEGNLVCAPNGKYYKWYWNSGKKFSYISKKQQALAEKLAMRKYLIRLRKELLAEYHAVRAYLSNHSQEEKESQQLLEHDEYQKLLRPYFLPVSQELKEWMEESYEQSQKYPEQLLHKCGSGHVVRSKSEAMIDRFLQFYKIPFRYECALSLNGVTIYPDFTIRHPQTGEVYYWEHFGMMDSLEYVRSYCSKMERYVCNGIIPSIQLITTYETKESPLSIETVERIIHQYFL